MTKENTHEYEDVEVVGKSASTQRARFNRASASRAQDQAREFRSNILWASFGTLFVFFLAVFVFLALVVTVLFWLLPFAFAALVVAGVIVLAVAAYQGVRNMFGGRK